MRTGNDYSELMKHALAGDPDARLDLLAVLNEAVHFIYQAHDWKFRKRPSLDLCFTVGQGWIYLPDDFGELIDVCTKNSSMADVEQTSLQDIAWRRGSANAVAYDGTYRVALSWVGQDNDQTNEAPLPRLEIWPTPTATNAAGDLTVTYRAGAVEMDDLDQVPNLPPQLSRLLSLTCRMFAQGYEEEAIQQDPLWQTEFDAQKKGDGRQQATIGQLQGGAVQQMRATQIREFQRITDPASRS